MYQDYSLHVSQYKNLLQGFVFRPCVVGPYKWNYGLAGTYNPELAKLLLNRHKR